MRHATAIGLLLCGCFSEDPVGAGASSGSSESSTSTTTTTGSGSSAPDTSSSEASTSTTAGGSGTSETGSESSSSTAEPITDWALYFDGETSAVSTGDLDLALGDAFTVEAWIRVDSADATGTIVSFLGVGTSGWSLGFDEVSELSWGAYDNNGAWHEVTGTNASELTPGWTHVAAEKSGSSLFLYVDGALDATAPTLVAASAPTVPVRIGDGTVHGPAQYFAIDDLRVSAGRRYEAAFDPSHDLEADATAQLRSLFDEGMGTIAISDGNVGATFSISDPNAWIEGASP